jgi:DNA-binding MarR family transcriptional regulator
MKKQAPKSKVSTSSPDQWRASNTGRLLVNATRHFEERIMNVVNAQGFPDIRVSHLSVPRNLDMDGTRITELARRAAMTKQSMSDIVNQCETMGLVTRRPDPSDQRAKVVVFTPKGRQLIEVIGKAIRMAESELRKRIGDTSFGILRAALLEYLAPASAPGTKRARGR